MRFNDRVSVGQTKQTSEGYLVATAKVARTGVQEYLAAELGDVAAQAGFNPGDIVRVYRHPDQVFSQDTLNSITRVPVTIDHPQESVSADNWSQYAVGEVGDAFAKDGEWIVVNPMIKDARGIEAAKSTHKEISMGYNANIVKARDGIDADFEMTDIRMNHLALVPRGRAGSQARIGDSWGAAPISDNQPGVTPNNRPKEGLMTTKTVVLGDKAVQVLVEDAAEVERFKQESANALVDAEDKFTNIIAAKDEEIGKLKAELADAKKAAEIDVDALVAARTELVAQVKAIDAKIEAKGLSDAELRKAAVAAKLGDEMVKDASEAVILGMFKAIAKDAKPADPVGEALKNGTRQPVGDAAAQMKDAFAKSVDDLNAWRYAQ